MLVYMHSKRKMSGRRKAEPVLLNVYDLGTGLTHCGMRAINTILGPLGAGAFHCGVEVHGREWSFTGNLAAGTGVFACGPRACRDHTFAKTVMLGEVPLSAEDVLLIIRRLERSWQSSAYRTLSRNCTHFCERLSAALGVGPIPAHLTSLTRTAESLEAHRRAIESVLAPKGLLPTISRTLSSGWPHRCCPAAGDATDADEFRELTPFSVPDEFPAPASTPLRP
mmetsp:Transcript_56610/g.168440  ORF Transcript_56610/g.168440 Transcript_56610/m.168440 type:complete len:224 (+) Transcript_56610:61-732(+)